MGKKKSSTRRKPRKRPAAEFREQAEPFMAALKKKATTDQEKTERLRAYHGLGKLSLSVRKRGAYDKGELKADAKEAGLSYGYLYAARRFADRYDEEELNELCKQPLGLNHLQTLLAVRAKKDRATLQKQAYEDKLSVKALGVLKKQKFGRKGSGRVPIKIADNPEVAVLDLLSGGDKWMRRCEATIPKLAKIGKRVPAGLRDVASEGIERLRAIAKAARQAEKELKRLSGDA